MPDRSLFTPDGDNPPFAVPIDDLCTVPTEWMAMLLADLLIGDRDASKMDVLEIGTGSGYQTAVLAERCRSIVSIDLQTTEEVAQRLPDHVALMKGNGYEVDTGEQFDGVLVTFGSKAVSPIWFRQVKNGGRLVVPIEVGGTCQISVYEKVGSGIILIDVAAYAGFTPGAEA